MIRAEFLRFIGSLVSAEMSGDEWRLVNLIHDHLEEIVPLGTAVGRRSKFIMGIALPGFDSLSAQTPQTTQEVPRAGRKLRRLSSLTVGPFRGFQRAQDFDLSNQIVLLYGPNGTGKSSFCEALEFTLLGAVNDCSAKRFQPDDFLQNARTGTFATPKLTALNENDVLEDVIASHELYRFCFVEKNRIDDFSRIASFTPNQQERLIASLFGIEEFNSFVGNFNESIESYIPIGSSAAAELQNLEASLAGDRQIVNTKEEALKVLADAEQLLASSYQEGMSYSSFVQTVGTAEGGAIKDLTDQLSEPLETRVGAFRAGLVDAVKTVRASWNARSDLQQTRLAKANDLSYRDLYNSVLALESSNPQICPACDTPLSGDGSVVANPYVKARSGLKGLTELAELESQIVTSTRQLETRANRLLSQLVHVEANLNQTESQNAQAVTLHEAIVAGRAEIAGGWWQELVGFDDESATSSLGFLLSCLERIEQHDNLLLEQEGRRAAERRELDWLTALGHEIVRRDTQRAVEERKIRDAENSLQNAGATISAAQEKANAESRANDVRRRITTAYSSLISRLQRYRENLPAVLLANLSQNVVALYNAFNRRDPAGDLMANIRLPLRSGDRIAFSCVSAPQDYFDALHVLSEGHIRCLGLAIVLAKNLQTDSPLVIFDDPVNAIDDDHREGIRLTLFKDPYFAGKQIILTCHGEDFTKDIQNLIGVAGAKECKSYTFLPHGGDNQIRVEMAATKNYIVSARNKLETNELRGSLADARRGVEWVANTIWTRVLPDAGVRGLSVMLARPGRPELFHLVQSLVNEMKRSSFTNHQKGKLVSGLNTILREWNQLNKATHEEEDRTEFDRGIVATVVQALEDLDAAVTASKQPLVLLTLTELTA